MSDYFDQGTMFLRQAVEMTPWARGGLVIAAIVGIVLAFPIGQLLRSNPIVVGMLIAAVGAVLVFTLTPQPRIYSAADTCLYTLSKPSRSDLVEPTDISLNLLLFFPIGILIMLLRPIGVILTSIAFTICLPVAIEYSQFAISRLGRTCSFYDIATNELGLVLGIAIGIVIRAIWEVINHMGRPNTYSQ